MVNIFKSDSSQIEVSNEKGETFDILWGDNTDLYWRMRKYRNDNVFIIERSEQNSLFESLEHAFSVIEEKDNKIERTLIENTFTWIGEERPPEEENKLVITKKENSFEIYFVLNESSPGFGGCAVCFAISGSRNMAIATEFSLMLHNLLRSETSKQKTIN